MKENKNIFQICINLNDNIELLKKSRKKLLGLNPDYEYHYIDSEDKFNEIMATNFKSSEDLFEQKIYESFDSIKTALSYGEKNFLMADKKRKEEIQRICILVSRTDIFRYAMLYKFGGLYCDLSSFSEVDIEKELAKYDFVALKSEAEVLTSFLYAKKHNQVIKKVLENLIEACSYRTIPKSLNQMLATGPGLLTNSILSISGAKNPTEDINLNKYNGIVLSGLECNFFKFLAPWKMELHEPDPDNKNKKINEHWLLMKKENKKTIQEVYENFKGGCGSGDKGTFHSYIDVYGNLFSPFREEKVNILEIGICGGQSIKLWFNFFENANIFGVDIRETKHLNLENERTFLFHNDATKKEFFNDVKNKKFKVIIDDGSHLTEDQISSFSLLKGLLDEGGIYIIEDVFPDHIDPIQEKFNHCFEVLDLRHERPDAPDNVLMIYKK